MKHHYLQRVGIGLGLMGLLWATWDFLPKPAVFQASQAISHHDLGFETQADYQRYEALAKSLRCIVCQNQNLWESNTQAAVSLKTILKSQIQEGRSDAELRRWMTTQYGDFISYDPPKTGLSRLLWLGPVMLLGFSFVVVRRKVRWSGFSGV